MDDSIEAMIAALLMEGLIQEKDCLAASTALKRYWAGKVAFIWTINNVLDAAEHEGLRMSEYHANRVLDKVKAEYDEAVGVNEETIRHTLIEYLESLDEKAALLPIEPSLNGKVEEPRQQ